MLTVLSWWFWLTVMGAVALPLAWHFFRKLPGRGYAFARPLGLLLVSYVLWLGGSFGLLRNSLGGILTSLVLVAAVSFVVYRRGRGGRSNQPEGAALPESAGEPGLLDWLRANWRLAFAVELLFAGSLALWSLLRAYSPELTTAGGEKFMEIMYLNSIARSDYFPPHDAWLAGYGISYYYFGYVMMATLTRLSGFPAHLTFNVGLASLFALTCTGAFGLVYDLVARHAHEKRSISPPIGWGFLGAFLVAVLGNLEGALEVLYSARALPERFFQWLDIIEINAPFGSAATSWIPTRSGWWWWRASRVIHDLDPLGNSMGVQPIDEFPGFSFLLGDMHPHVLALPFLLLALAVAFRTLLDISGRHDGAADGHWLAPARHIPLLVPLALGALGFLNTWDLPISLLIFVAAYALGRWPCYGRITWPFLRDVGLVAGLTAVASFLLYLPFYLSFQSQAGGLLPTLYVGTRFRQYFVMFAPFLVALTVFFLLAALQLRERVGTGPLLRRWGGWTAVLILVPLAAMVALVALLLLTEPGRAALEGIRRVPAVYEIVGDQVWPAVLAQLVGVKLRTWVMPLVVGALAALGLTLIQLFTPPLPPPQGGGETSPPSPVSQAVERGARGEERSLHFVLLCAIAGLLLTLSVEFVYLVDNFGVRMNTIFKFYFQAWVLMAIASAFAIYWLGQRVATRRRWFSLAFRLAFWLFFALGMVYPVLGNAARAGNFQPEPTLDGTAYLAQSQADDYAAIAWLNDNVQGAPVILEQPGGSYASYVYEGRVSALTGLPTLLGWPGHESQWRGSYEIQAERAPVIETIYKTPDPDAAASLLDKYGVTYVYVGPLERSTYDRRALEKFGYFMDVVYENEGVTIYKRE
ncbi:MAG: hypothetical protein JXA93_13425 [Anaerolineae bacterium]|nr:hypothetical protein [Anaerolineae bacterium]